MENFKISLKAARINANLTQREAADKIGVTAKSIENWESGKHKTTIDNIAALSEVYGIPLSYILMP